jgi:hypothetical protein
VTAHKPKTHEYAYNSASPKRGLNVKSPPVHMVRGDLHHQCQVVPVVVSQAAWHEKYDTTVESRCSIPAATWPEQAYQCDFQQQKWKTSGRTTGQAGKRRISANGSGIQHGATPVLANITEEQAQGEVALEANAAVVQVINPVSAQQAQRLPQVTPAALAKSTCKTWPRKPPYPLATPIIAPTLEAAITLRNRAGPVDQVVVVPLAIVNERIPLATSDFYRQRRSRKRRRRIQVRT